MSTSTLPPTQHQQQQQQQQQQSTNDLRSHAKDYKRDIDSKRKWSPKWVNNADIPLARPSSDENAKNRPPRRRVSQTYTACLRNHSEKSFKKTQAERKTDVLAGGNKQRRCTTIESSTEDDDEFSSHTSESPEPECADVEEIISGQVVLASALTKAMERYDHQTLVKLIKDEYEVLEDVDEEGHGVKVAGGDFDEEFELV